MFRQIFDLNSIDIVTCADTALSFSAACNLIIAGDLNQLPTSDLTTTLNLKQCVNAPTRGNSILDKILIENSISEAFHEPAVMPNFGNTDHFCLYQTDYIA